VGNCIDIRIDEHIAEVMLNRPEKFNALDLDTFDALDEAARTIEAESSVRAVVLHGAGENFCAGIDLSVMQGGISNLADSLLSPVEGSLANRFQRAAYCNRGRPAGRGTPRRASLCRKVTGRDPRNQTPRQ